MKTDVTHVCAACCTYMKTTTPYRLPDVRIIQHISAIKLTKRERRETHDFHLMKTTNECGHRPAAEITHDQVRQSLGRGDIHLQY